MQRNSLLMHLISVGLGFSTLVRADFCSRESPFVFYTT